MDGSAKPFVDAILSHGMKISDVPNPPLKFEHPLWVVDGDKYLILLPGEGLKVTYHIDFPHPLLKGQTVTMNLDPDTVLKEILPARTFGFLKDVESLQSRGLALGGSIDNAVVLTDSGFLNDSLRYENECVRHKVLDLIGDLALVGRPLTGHLIAYKAGHALDVSLARCIQEKIAQQESTNIRYFRKQNISSG
jgi:UDP-3-O-[3-hydroxymyristoyl] N-acetylglucosamine deacetylase